MERNEIRREELIKLVCEATKLFYEENKPVFFTQGNTIHEIAFETRLAFYLQTLLNLEPEKYRDYIVDCEYNRNGKNFKEMRTGKKIRPDIIVHKRMTNDNNLIIFEIKKNPSTNKAQEKDKDKLCHMTKDWDEKNSAYKLGVFILIEKEEVKLTFFESGDKIDEKIIF